MKSDVIQVYSDLKGRAEAMKTAESFAAYNGFTGKKAMHVRLLTEELISMVNGIMDSFSGNMWFESEKTDKGIMCRICLSAQKSADILQEGQLLGVAEAHPVVDGQHLGPAQLFLQHDDLLGEGHDLPYVRLLGGHVVDLHAVGVHIFQRRPGQLALFDVFLFQKMHHGIRHAARHRQYND